MPKSPLSLYESRDFFDTLKKVGKTVDLEGFLYWYEGPNPHITGIGIFP